MAKDDTQVAGAGDDTVVADGVDTVGASGTDSVDAGASTDTIESGGFVKPEEVGLTGAQPETPTDHHSDNIDHRLLDAIEIYGNFGDPLTLVPGPDLDEVINRANMIPHPMTSVPTPEGLVHRDWIHRVVDLWLDNREPNPGDSWLAKATD